ncbi:MAG: oligosaccharide flippase family protein [Acidobacteriota bacterium]|nr:MAG: oligosaccharide flippase family protein [Acidobacteriota bacterium]
MTRFAKHSAVYTIGNVIYRGASFLLIPLYAHYLSPDQFGLLEILYVTAAIFHTLFASGVAHASLRFYFEYDKEEDRNTVISSTLLGSLAVSVVGVAALWVLAPRISRLLLSGENHALAFRLAFAVVIFEISREICLAFIRARERSVLFVAISVCQLVIQVSANVIAIVYLEWGVVGVLAGNLFTAVTIWMLLAGVTFGTCGFRFDFAKLWPVVKYGNPLMLSSFGGSLFRSADRYLLNAFASLSSVGFYALGMRIVNVVEVMVHDPFTKSYGPYRFSIMREQDARVTYARILRYYLVINACASLGLCLFAEQVVELIASAEYRGAAWIVPLLVMQFPLRAMTYCFQTGIYVQKKTDAIFKVTMTSGCVALTANIVLIPWIGVYGAAITTAIQAGFTAVMTYVMAQRLYAIPYELRRLNAVIGVTIVWALLGLQIDSVSLVNEIVAKGALLTIYLPAILLARGIDREELASLKRWATDFGTILAARRTAS